MSRDAVRARRRAARRGRPDYRRPTVSASAIRPRHDVIDAAAVRAALGRCRLVVERHAAYLTRLDTVLGDGDHGDNLVIGFRAVEALLDDLPPRPPPGELLRAVGHRLVAAVGGASGPLYGTAFLEAGANAATPSARPRRLGADAPRGRRRASRAAGAARSATRPSSTRSHRPRTPSRPHRRGPAPVALPMPRRSVQVVRRAVDPPPRRAARPGPPAGRALRPATSIRAPFVRAPAPRPRRPLSWH